ncbi:hypothetical protein [Echinicola shivajiensis]|uniref:hypothetical protein n=1 Tax=Echinicola shivajiensis TaxID=1035916 RepID=UPI001BFC9233|nr:hypothetical protein [Echinicola shivajiensis]
MKKLITYHIVTLLPMMLVMQLYVFRYISFANFLECFIVYFVVYRPIIDYRRLKSKGLVNRKEFLKSWGFVRFKYYQELMFKK